MPLETPSRIVQALTSRGYNAEREAVTLIANASDPAAALERAVEAAPDDALSLTAAHVRAVLDVDRSADAPVTPTAEESEMTPDAGNGATESSPDPTVSTGTTTSESGDTRPNSPVETKGSDDGVDSPSADGTESTSENAGTGGSNNGSAGETPEATKAVAAATSDAAPDRSARSQTAATADEPSPSGSSPSTTTSDAAGTSSDTTGDATSSDTTGDSTTVDTTTVDTTTVDTTTADTTDTDSTRSRDRDPSKRSIEIAGDVTGRSTGTGEYDDFVRTFKDRYERLSKLLRGRVNHRPATAIESMPGGSDVEMIGLVNDIRSTASGHWLVELEDTTGTFPALVMKDRDISPLVDEMLLDETVAVQGTLSDDAGIIFTDAIHFPDVPRTFRPTTADRHVQAALISDVHVGSQEFMADAWHRFADWLHSPEAEAVEYLLIAGDMVEGVGIYPNQDEELDIVDIYDQYEAFAEHLKEVPGDMEVVMIPGNHDAVRLAEPQPGFDDELREIMSAHDARITGNPSTVTVEGVSVLMYHGVSLDEVIAELPAEKASYDEPHKAMYQLLKKRHVAPQYGGHTRVAPEERDYLVIEDVPEVFHTGHVHKLGWGRYHNVIAVNSGCWQAQTAFQESVNIDPDSGYAPILDLDTLEMTVRKFA